MSLTNGEVVDRFYNGATKGRNARDTLFIDGEVMYSYGHHFPLMIRTKGPDGDPLFILNGDKSTPTTARHQRECWGGDDVITTAFSALPFLSAYLAYPKGNPEARVLDFRKDERHSRFFSVIGVPLDEDQCDEYILDAGPAIDRLTEGRLGFTVTVRRADAEPRYVTSILAHRPGALVIKFRRRKYLASMDEGSYFVSMLPYHSKVESVDDAFKVLQPPQLLELDPEEQAEVVRQGEWFFRPRPDVQTRELPCPSEKQVDLAAMLKIKNDGNWHVVGQARRKNGSLFVRGAVTHRVPGNARYPVGPSTGQHPRVSLGKVWHEVWRNRAVESWSAEGDVD